MKLTIKQSNTPEIVTSEVIDGLYNLSSGGNLTNDSELEGNLQATAAYEDSVTYLTSHFPRLTINAASYYIRFADPEVESVIKTALHKAEGEGITTQEAGNIVADYFQNNTDIESFDELKYFKTGSYIFRGCSSLKSIDITGKESQVDCYDNQSIEYFYGIDGPKGFVSTDAIGTSFSGCGGVTTLELTCKSNTYTNSYRSMGGLQTLIWKVSPGVVLGSYSFYNTPLLERVVVDDLDSFWTNNMGWGSGSPFQNKIAKLIVNDVEVTSVTVPQTITQIQPGNWCGARLTSCVFHSAVTSIGTHAFDGCDLLVIQDLNLPNLITLDTYSFSGTKVQTISDLGSVTNIPEGCFKGCSQLTTIDQGVLDNITSLGKEAFNNCTNLGSAKQSDNTISSVLRLPNLTSIALDSVRYTKFTEIADLGNITTVTGFSEMTNLTSVVLPQTCTTIGDSAFVNDKALTTINLNNITSIGASAFNGCNNLIYFHGAGSAAGELNLSNVTFIGKFAFQNCKNLTSLAFSNSVTSIGENAFNSCSGLTSITIPNSVTSIGGGAFRNCTGLTSLTIGDGVTTIGIDAFNIYNAHMNTVILGSSLTTVNRAGLNFNIDGYMICKATTPPSLSACVFNGNGLIYVPTGSESAYQSASEWSTYAGRIKPMSEFPNS